MDLNAEMEYDMMTPISAADMDDMESKALFQLYKDSKDIGIRNELIKRYLYITEILSKKYINKGIDYEDIYQVASLGLIYAIERFDDDEVAIDIRVVVVFGGQVHETLLH